MKFLFLIIIVTKMFADEINPESFGLGFKPASFELISKIKEANPNKILHRGLPSRFDISEQMPPVGNQGQQSSCVAWSVAYATKSYQEFIERKEQKNWSYLKDGKPNPSTLFSPSFIYNQINGGKDNGSVIENALALVVNKGAVSLEEMPYNPKDFLTMPTKLQLERATKFKAQSFLRVKATELNEIKNQISNGRPVITGIPVSEGFYNLKKDEVYNTPRGTNFGGHAIVLVGYDDSLQAFKIQNSWGIGWGDKGFGYIGYRFFMKNAYSGYVLVDIIDPKKTDTPIIPTNVDNVNIISEEILPPKEIYATEGNYPDKIIISWQTVKNAIGYEIYRAYPEETNFQKIGLSQSTSFEDSSVFQNQAYVYKIASVSQDEISEPSVISATGYADSEKQTATPEKILNLQASSGEFYDKVVLTWTQSNNSAEYNVYKFLDQTGTFRLIGKTKSLVFEDKQARKNGVPESYIVVGANLKSLGTASDAVYGKTAISTKPAPVQSISATKGVHKDKIEIRWTEVAGADSYMLYRYAREKWEPIAETKSPNYIDTNVRRGLYYYTAIAKNDNESGEYSKYSLGFIDPNLFRGATKLEPPKNLFAVVNKNSQTASLSWTEVENVFEYNIWEKKQGDSKWKFKGRVDSSRNFFTFNIPERETFYLYSVTAKTEMSADSDYSNSATVVLSSPKAPIKSRAFANNSKLEKFKGTWSAIKWDEKFGSKNVVLEINSEEGNNLVITLDNKKTLKTNYIPGANTIDVNGKMKISLSGTEGALSVEVFDKSLLNEKAELSFLKE
jgi:C1A family cysteine protease/fibronectin type 3 domain-containing protein